MLGDLEKHTEEKSEKIKESKRQGEKITKLIAVIALVCIAAIVIFVWGNFKNSKEKAQEASLYDIVIDHDLSNVVIDGMDERYNAKFLNGDEIKNIIIGSWFARMNEDPHWLLTFNADGTIEQRDRLSNEWDLTNNDVKWTVENDELKIETVYAMDGSSNVENYKLLCISDDILILYNPDSEYIEFVYIRQNSDWADKCLKHYGIQ